MSKKNIQDIMSIKGYKVFNSDWTCKDFQYEVGKTFEHKGGIAICGSGFHFCKRASDCFNYYSFDSNNRVAEVEAIGNTETNGDKSVTDKITIVKEISWNDLLNLVNLGNNNTGLRNSGNYNNGDYNSGHYNSGNYNSSHYNSGHYNNGWSNSGYYNSGNYNSGYHNSGHHNSGYYNSGNYNSGWFSTITPKLSLFEKETELTREEVLNIKGIKILNQKCKNTLWVCEENMTNEEKEKYPSYKTTGGYLKTISHKETYKIMWEKLSKEEKSEIQKIPNFNAKIFKEITGIDVNIEKNNS